MAEQAADSLHIIPRALAEPIEPVTRGWIGSLGLASLVMWMASITPLQVLIPEQLQNIDNKGKILALGLVSAFGAVSSLLATPIAGALSDRTTHTYAFGRMRGRRHRWTLAMAILSAVSLALIAGQKTVLGVGILWVLFSAFQNGEYASLSAAVPDHVPVNQRATVAGWVGMPQALGLVVGTAVVVYLFGGNLLGGYLALAIPLVLLTLPFVLLTDDHPLGREHRAPLSVRTLLRSYWIDPRRYPDFAWAWITRFLASLAIGMGTLYLLYFLRDQVHYKHPVDQALITQVLPAARDRAKDLGIINIAIVGPAAVAGAIAALLVSIGGYPALFAATAVVAAIGSVLVWKIKSVP
jgi:hypothetical protein